MTVGELAEELKKYPQDAIILFDLYNTAYYHDFYTVDEEVSIDRVYSGKGVYEGYVFLEEVEDENNRRNTAD